MLSNKVKSYSCKKDEKLKEVFLNFVKNNDLYLDIDENTKIIKKNNLVNTRNVLKYQLATILLNNWMLYEVFPNEFVFVKHILSEKENLLYQIILSEDDFSGVYEFQFVGKKIAIDSFDKYGYTYLQINSNGNFELALFKNNSVVCKMEQTEKQFISSLKNYLSEDEINMYYKPKSHIKNYLIRNLPRIILQSE